MTLPGKTPFSTFKTLVIVVFLSLNCLSQAKASLVLDFSQGVPLSPRLMRAP